MESGVSEKCRYDTLQSPSNPSVMDAPKKRPVWLDSSQVSPPKRHHRGHSTQARCSGIAEFQEAHLMSIIQATNWCWDPSDPSPSVGRRSLAHEGRADHEHLEGLEEARPNILFPKTLLPAGR